jgi:hypothetical protein
MNAYPNDHLWTGELPTSELVSYDLFEFGSESNCH